MNNFKFLFPRFKFVLQSGTHKQLLSTGKRDISLFIFNVSCAKPVKIDNSFIYFIFVISWQNQLQPLISTVITNAHICRLAAASSLIRQQKCGISTFISNSQSTKWVCSDKKLYNCRICHAHFDRLKNLNDVKQQEFEETCHGTRICFTLLHFVIGKNRCELPVNQPNSKPDKLRYQNLTKSVIAF